MMKNQEALTELIAEVLDQDLVDISIRSFKVFEAFESGQVELSATLYEKREDQDIELKSDGVGTVHAFFNGLLEHFSSAYPSLKSINFADFRVEGELSAAQTTSRSDGGCTAVLLVRTSEEEFFEFRHNSSSVTSASLASVTNAVAFFINSERAFVQLHNALAYARTEHRQDSVQRYTKQLTRLVEATSYSAVIDKLKEDL